MSGKGTIMSSLERNIQRLQRTNTGLDEIYREMEKAVFLVAYSYLKDKYLAEDVRQEVFVKVAQNISGYRKGTNAKAWILTIAKNLSLNLLKKRRECFVDFTENESLYGTYSVEDRGGDNLIERARDILSQEQFEIVYLVVVAGYKRREIAEYLQMPIGTVTWKYNESLKLLKNAFKEEI